MIEGGIFVCVGVGGVGSLRAGGDEEVVDSDERCDSVEVDGGGMTDVECVEFGGELLNVVVLSFFRRFLRLRL